MRQSPWGVRKVTLRCVWVIFNGCIYFSAYPIMLKRIGLALAMAIGFAYAWQRLDQISLEVVGQPSMTGYVQSELEQPFFEHLAESTGLPLHIDYRTIDTLGIRDDYQLRLLKTGALDMVSLRFLQNASTEPTFLGLDLLGLSTDFPTARAVVDVYAPVLDRRLQEKFHSKLLGVWPFGPQVFFCRQPIQGLTDLAGLKIRVGNANFAPLINSFGGTPVVITFEEVRDALRNGLVDCAITSAGSGQSAGWAEHATHFFPLGTQMGINGYAINLNQWNRLSAKQQQVMEQAFQQHADRIWGYAKQVHERASSCLTSGVCEIGRPYQLTLVQPSASDYALIQESVYKTTFKDWATRCDEVYPGCSSEWRTLVEPLLTPVQAGSADRGAGGRP